ncbi:hypothetical protein DFH09DRAFT_1074922 [Mycena vulgaris]|nr:hypothetical protein DFH09DRAFT_1074922 [Mycena vulgaris]
MTRDQQQGASRRLLLQEAAYKHYRRGTSAAGASSAGAGPNTAPAADSAPAAANVDKAANADNEADEAPAKKHVRNPWGIRLKEVAPEVKQTQHDHYDKRFDKVEDHCAHMNHLVDESRTAVTEAAAIASSLIKDTKRIESLCQATSRLCALRKSGMQLFTNSAWQSNSDTTMLVDSRNGLQRKNIKKLHAAFCTIKKRHAAWAQAL